MEHHAEQKRRRERRSWAVVALGLAMVAIGWLASTTGLILVAGAIAGIGSIIATFAAMDLFHTRSEPSEPDDPE